MTPRFVPIFIFNALMAAAWLLPFSVAVAGEGDDKFADEDDQEESDSGPAVQETGVGGKQKPTKDNAGQAAEAEEMRVASSSHVRRFHEVLDELMAEFGYDVKMGQIKGLSNLAVRQVRVSQAIPRTYEEYLEIMIEERIRENSQVRLIACVPCKTRTSSLVDGKMMITSPSTNMAKLEAAATMLGVENFMDAVLVYHTTHMVLAVSVFNAQTKELVWARTYNSETIKSRYQKLAIDYSQVAKSRPGEDYVPEYRVLLGFGGAAIPNVGGTAKDSTMLNLQIRATEKFNNRHTEFGMMLSMLKTTASTLKAYPSEQPTDKSTTTTAPPATETKVTKPVPKPFATALAIYGMYSHVFLGSIESYNESRQGVHFGLGMLAATGYLAPAARVGWDIFMGRRFGASFGGNYIGSSSILVDGESVKTKGGAGGDVILSVNF